MNWYIVQAYSGFEKKVVELIKDELKKNKLSGIIDFYFAANDYFMYELAICVNSLCFDKSKSKFKLNKAK